MSTVVKKCPQCVRGKIQGDFATCFFCFKKNLTNTCKVCNDKITDKYDTCFNCHTKDMKKCPCGNFITKPEFNACFECNEKAKQKKHKCKCGTVYKGKYEQCQKCYLLDCNKCDCGKLVKKPFIKCFDCNKIDFDKNECDLSRCKSTCDNDSESTFTEED